VHECMSFDKTTITLPIIPTPHFPIIPINHHSIPPTFQ
jgi:hypothetical protein